jgi:hypothetical protein
VHFLPWQVCAALIVMVVYYLGLRIAEQRIQLRKVA